VTHVRVPTTITCHLRHRLALRGHERQQDDGDRPRRRRGQAAQGLNRRDILRRPLAGEEGRRRQEGRSQAVGVLPAAVVRAAALPPPAVRRPQHRGGPQLLRHLLVRFWAFAVSWPRSSAITPIVTPSLLSSLSPMVLVWRLAAAITSLSLLSVTLGWLACPPPALRRESLLGFQMINDVSRDVENTSECKILY
jgi:hypothetical protein